MPGINVSDNNLAEINRMVESLKDRLTPNKKLMTEIAGELHASVEENFRNEGADVPGGWPKLRPSTVKSKNRKNVVLKILQQHGNLFKSIQTTVTDNEVIESTSVRYAAIHQLGGSFNIGARSRTLRHRTDAKGNLLKRGKNNNLLIFAKNSHKRALTRTFGQGAYNITIPARPFMILTDKYRNNIISIIHRHVNPS